MSADWGRESNLTFSPEEMRNGGFRAGLVIDLSLQQSQRERALTPALSLRRGSQVFEGHNGDGEAVLLGTLRKIRGRQNALGRRAPKELEKITVSRMFNQRKGFNRAIRFF